MEAVGVAVMHTDIQRSRDCIQGFAGELHVGGGSRRIVPVFPNESLRTARRAPSPAPRQPPRGEGKEPTQPKEEDGVGMTEIPFTNCPAIPGPTAVRTQLGLL